MFETKKQRVKLIDDIYAYQTYFAVRNIDRIYLSDDLYIDLENPSKLYVVSKMLGNSVAIDELETLSLKAIYRRFVEVRKEIERKQKDNSLIKKKFKQKFISFAVITTMLTLISSRAYAIASVNTQSQTQSSTSASQTLQNNKSINQTNTQSKQRSITTQSQSTSSSGIESSNTHQTSNSYTVTMPLSTVILQSIKIAESIDMSNNFFSQCQLVTDPQYALVQTEQDGVVDLLKQQYYQSIAQNNQQVQQQDVKRKAMQITNCMILYANAIKYAIAHTRQARLNDNQFVIVFAANLIKYTHTDYYRYLINNIASTKLVLNNNMLSFTLYANELYRIILPYALYVDGVKTMDFDNNYFFGKQYVVSLSTSDTSATRSYTSHQTTTSVMSNLTYQQQQALAQGQSEQLTTQFSKANSDNNINVAHITPE